MQLVNSSVEFLWHTAQPLKIIERAGRTCYKSEHRITKNSATKFVQMLLSREHEAMIEHASASYKFTCDRGVSHEIVRHRLFSFAQESTRYCNYKGGVTFIIPPWVKSIRPGTYKKLYKRWNHIAESSYIWLKDMLAQEQVYKELLDLGHAPQEARAVLPNSLKTEIVVTGNLREWRHFFKLRCAHSAHPQIREIAQMTLRDIRSRIPVVFDNLKIRQPCRTCGGKRKVEVCDNCYGTDKIGGNQIMQKVDAYPKLDRCFNCGIGKPRVIPCPTCNKQSIAVIGYGAKITLRDSDL